MIRVWCVVFDSCGPQFVRVISRLHRVACFSYRVSHSARVISVDVCHLAASVSVDPCVPRSRVGPSYSLSRVLRYLVRS